MFNGHICSNIVIFSYLNDIERTGGVYESFVPGEDCRGMGLRAKIKSAEHAPAL